MIFASVRAAIGHLFSPDFRTVFWKSLGLSIVAVIALWFGLTWLFDRIALPFLSGMTAGLQGAPDLAAWLGWLASTFGPILAGVVLAFGLAFLIGPITALIAGLFLDDVAEKVERTDFPDDPPGVAVPTVQALLLSLKFFGVVVLGNALAFALLLVPGVNLVIFFLVNGYLLGREFFEFAAMRFRPEHEAKALRRRHGGTVFAAGLVIAGWLAVPILNLTTPLFAAALMVHLHKRLARRDAAGAR